MSVKPDGRHRVIANGFIAVGNDGFTGFLKGTDCGVELLDVEVLVNYHPCLPYSPPPVGERNTRLYKAHICIAPDIAQQQVVAPAFPQSPHSTVARIQHFDG